MITEHLQYIAGITTEKHLYDFGCGNLDRAALILNSNKNSFITGVDCRRPVNIIKGIKFLEVDLSQHTPKDIGDIALIAWPINRSVFSGGPNWKTILAPYREVIYIGKNTGGTCCGSPELWKALEHREVLEVLPDQKETMIHYGSAQRIGATPCEEFYGIEAWRPNGKIYHYTTDKFIATRKIKT